LGKYVMSEDKYIVKALFYVDPIDINMADLPSLLKEELKQFVDNHPVSFYVGIKGEKDSESVQDIVEQNNHLKEQVKFWQELYLKAIKQEG
jgi:hypothetical protein